MDTLRGRDAEMNQSIASNAPSERFLSASALYYCDLSRDGEPCFLLGHLVELVRPPYFGLGLAARTRLDDRELRYMDEIGRRLLSRPFDYLHEECARVRHSASPGCALAALSASHHAALRIAPPQETPTPFALAGGEADCTAMTVIAGLSDMLRDRLALAGQVSVDTFCQEL